MDYWLAGEDVQEIGEKYLRFHPDLIGAHIAFLMKERATKRDGVPVVAQARKVPAKYKPMMQEQPNGDFGFDFFIEIGADAWGEISQETREAWIDHCLEQCYGEEKNNGETVWKLRKPEISAFPVIINRHGTNWDSGVNKLRTLRLNNQPQVREPEVRSTQEEETDTEGTVEASQSG